MKTAIVLLLLISSIQATSQTIFEYEREIQQQENYNFQEIEFENPDAKIKLSGTLISPKSDFERLIVIVAGSGKDTRYTHPKLAETFLQNNIAVYRFDERGIGKSEGEYSYHVSSLKNDLNCCIKHLRSIQPTKNIQLGILGHSLGGLATIGLSEYHPDIDFLIQMATPINAGESFSNRIPKEELFQSKGKSTEDIKALIDTFNYVIRTTDNLKAIKKRCARISKKLNFPDIIRQTYLKTQFVEMIQLDAEFYYKNMNKPLLFIIGKDDQSVNVSYGVQKLKEFNNEFIRIKVLENMDHYLTYNGGEWSKSKKSEIREIDDLAVNEMIRWIEKNN